MKILQVLGGGAWGGGSVVVLAITRALIKRGDKVWVVALDQETREHFERAGAIAVSAPFWFRPINPMDFAPFVWLFGLCLRERFDLVVTHTSKGGFLGRLAARLAGVPRIIHHMHGFSFHQSSPPNLVRFYSALERFAARACNLIISVSEEHRQAAIQLGIKSPDQIRTVHNGINVSRFHVADRAAARRRFGFRGEELVIGATGRLADQKGFQYLIRALPEVAKRFPNVRLVVAGEGPYLEQLRQEAADADVADRVEFLGFS